MTTETDPTPQSGSSASFHSAKEEILTPQAKEEILTPQTDDSLECDIKPIRSGIAESWHEVSVKYHELTEDVYSLICISPYGSGAFRFSVFAIAFHYAVILLVLVDLFKPFNKNNPLHIPPSTSTQVRAAMAFALFLAVATQGDVIVAVLQLQHGYNREMIKVTPYVTKAKWILSAVFQLVAGFLYIITIFILVLQSTTVIGMMLNFAALGFIMEIDNVAFSLAKEGFITSGIEKEAKRVKDLKFKSRPFHRKLRRVIFFGIYVCLMIGYGVLIHQQMSGKFMCQSLYLQIGYGFQPTYASFSGIYKQTGKSIGGRISYRDTQTGKVLLAYCKEENAWTASLYDDDPCKYWFVKSAETRTYDIITTAGDTWQVGDVPKSAFFNDATFVSLRQSTMNPNSPNYPQSFALVCNDCESRGSCSGHGQCSKKKKENKCICDEGWYGMNCQFKEPCPLLSADLRTEWFPWVTWESKKKLSIANANYGLLRDDNETLVTVYDRPVYAYFNKASGIWSIILFLGRRWYITNSYVYQKKLRSLHASRAQLIRVLKKYNHAFFHESTVLFASDPMDFGSPENAYTPVGLGWHNVRTNSDKAGATMKVLNSPSLDTVLLCSKCDDWVDNGCFDGFCNATTKTCNCDEGYIGVLCEKFNGSDGQWNQSDFLARRLDTQKEVIFSSVMPIP